MPFALAKLWIIFEISNNLIKATEITRNKIMLSTDSIDELCKCCANDIKKNR